MPRQRYSGSLSPTVDQTATEPRRLLTQADLRDPTRSRWLPVGEVTTAPRRLRTWADLRDHAGASRPLSVGATVTDHRKLLTLAYQHERAAHWVHPGSVLGVDYQRLRREVIRLRERVRALLPALRAPQRVDLSPLLTAWHHALSWCETSKLLRAALQPCTFVWLALIALIMGTPLSVTLVLGSAATLIWLTGAQVHDAGLKLYRELLQPLLRGELGL